MFKRYNIVEETDLVEAAEKLELRRSKHTNGHQEETTGEIGHKLVTSSKT